MSVLFFDRFNLDGVQNEPDKNRDLELQSIIDEVTRLLNTKCAFPEIFISILGQRNILFYGLPDFVHLSPRSRADARLLAKYIVDCINHYEPRFIVNSVIVESPRAYRDVITAVISGVIKKKDKTSRTVNFPITVGTAL
jgi:type VI secretion system lysozyme-like protein